MMVAVRGMKMPKNCMECPLFDGEYGDCNIIGETKADATEERAKNCPLVEIVTCKDCKYYKRIELNSCDEVITFCEKHSDKNCRYTSPNFYCADAERRE